jgi:cell division protease FtsH
MSLRSEQETSFLGDDWNTNREYSELTAQKADQEISQILESAYLRAREILTQHRDGLDRVIEALLEKEQIFGPELNAALNVNNERPQAS